jgi:peptidyl-prolyl cis-trans isomerase D
MPSRDIRRSQKRKAESVSDTIEKRHSTHPMIYVGTVIVLIIVVFAFVLAGPGGPMSRGGGQGGAGNIVFGSYMGKDIAYYQGSYFAQQRDNIAAQARSNPSQNTLAEAQSVWYQAFINTAEHIAILAQADAAGVRISEDALDTALLKNPAYLDDNGRFSETRFAAVSSSEKAATRKLTREELEKNVFFTDISIGVKSGSKETDFIKNMLKPERSFSFVSWPFTAFPIEEVRRYGEANKSRFAKIKVSRILVKASESQATEIRKKIVDKISTFEELAKTYSKDAYADKGGDMGWRYAYDLEADFEAKDTAKKVLSLKSGELSDVLKGTFGWMVYRCNSDATDPDFSNPSTLDDVKSYITKYEKGKIEDYYNEKAAQFTRRAAEVGFDQAGREAGVKAIPMQPFPLNLGNMFSLAPVRAIPDTATPTSAVYSEDFFYRAFSLGKDQVSAPVVLDDQVLVMKLTGEQQLPDAMVNILGNWVSYVANQSIQSDLAQMLMSPDKLKDNFAAAFSQYVMPNSAKQ